MVVRLKKFAPTASLWGRRRAVKTDTEGVWRCRFCSDQPQNYEEILSTGGRTDAADIGKTRLNRRGSLRSSGVQKFAIGAEGSIRRYETGPRGREAPMSPRLPQTLCWTWLQG